MIAFKLIITVLAILLTLALASRYGLYKPNLYFAVTEKSPQAMVVGLAWIVKDWRTDLLIVRHAM
jgi:hypothetical protein